MTQYLRQLIERIKIGDKTDGRFRLHIQVAALAEELHRLDPRDFEPAAQAHFVEYRANLTHYGQVNSLGQPVANEMLDKILPLLDSYRGVGRRGVTRTFTYLSDPDLQAIVERDYAELTLVLFPGAAWKSTVIMAGSILEAILFDVLSDAKRVAQTNASSKAPKAKGGVPIDILVDPDPWKLIHLINVAVSIGVLPLNRANTIDQVLRDYRNFVHPKKELKAQHECNEAEAGVAKYGLDGVCDHLEKTL